MRASIALVVALAFLTLPGVSLARAQDSAAVSLKVTEPLDYQVFQQDAAGQAVIKVTVLGAAPGSKVIARLDLLPGPGYTGEDGSWTALQENNGIFSGHILGTAGGWYTVLVRCTEPSGKFRPGLVPHIGVGEVLITAGQSNAANYGETPQKPTDDRVVAFDGKTWQVANDPQPGAGGAGGSTWPHLGDLLARNLQVPIGFVSLAVGGADSAAWLPDKGDLFPRLVQTIQPLGRQGARILLWHQGEADTVAGTSAEEYAKRLTAVMKALDKQLGWHLPWMVAQAAYGFGPRFPEAQQEQVRQGQGLLWQRGLAFQGPLTDDLTGPAFRAKEGGEWIHFNTVGLQTVAERWFALLWAQLYSYPYLVPGTGQDLLNLPEEGDLDKLIKGK
jgi:hypothetical protein